MPCIQPLLAPDELRGAPAHGDCSHLPVSDNSSSSSIGSPLEAFGDVPSRQAPCRVEALSACIDSPARARIIAVMALDIFASGTPLNRRFDRWICPFSNCKRGFSDPRDMLLHAAKCIHVSPIGAYCNCCCEYYNFPGSSRAYRISAGDSVSSGAKTSTMAKGKKKISDLISRCSGSASSSRSQLSAVGQRFNSCTSSGSDSMSESPTASRKGSTVSSAEEPSTSVRPLAELADYHVVELDNSAALPNRPAHELDANVCTQERSAQSSFSTLSTISTTGYVEPMSTDYGVLCMSPTDYTASDLQHNGGTQTREAGIPYATGEGAQHHTQTALATPQDAFWNLGQGHDVPWSFDESAPSSQTTQEHEVVVPNFSFPLHGLAAGNGGDGGFNFHDPHHQTAVSSTDEPQSQSSSDDSFDFFDHQSLGYGSLEVGIAVISTEPIGIAESNVETRPTLPRLFTGSSGFSSNIRHGDDMRCQESGCTYRPNGAEAHRQANLNKHVKHMHGDRPTLPCERCGAFFTRKDNLLAHQRDVCGRRRAQRHSAYRNRRSSRRRATRRVLINP